MDYESDPDVSQVADPCRLWACRVHPCGSIAADPAAVATRRCHFASSTPQSALQRASLRIRRHTERERSTIDVDAEDLGRQTWRLLKATMDERARLWAGTEACGIGHGGAR